MTYALHKAERRKIPAVSHTHFTRPLTTETPEKSNSKAQQQGRHTALNPTPF